MDDSKIYGCIESDEFKYYLNKNTIDQKQKFLFDFELIPLKDKKREFLLAISSNKNYIEFWYFKLSKEDKTIVLKNFKIRSSMVY